MNKNKTTLLSAEQERLFDTLKKRFEDNMNRHQNIEWSDVKSRLEANPKKVWSLMQMENTGGEPDLIGFDPQACSYIFCDCSPETPEGRRNVCYDREALESRKKFPPEHNAVEMAEEMGIDLLTEEQYRELQELGEFDTKTSSWLKTPSEIRALGGALFGDRRYNQVFIYHNGAESYYKVRGFRGLVIV